jgi:hypothetical protein
MIRRLNYTGRIRLSREDTQIVLEQQNDKFSFRADLRLGDYKLPSDALVFVEAYRQSIWMRFAFGTVGAVLPAANRVLSEFDTPEDVRFRVKVTKAADQHILLAAADEIPLRRADEQEGGRLPLLPVKPEDLEHQLWRLDFSDDKPRLLINSSAGDWRAIARSPAFHALVYPAALREVLTRVLIIDGHDDRDDLDDWRSLWMRFAVSLPGMDSPPSEDEGRYDWVDSAVQAFAKKNEAFVRFTEFWRGEST